MLEKTEILLVIFLLLVSFYLVIAWGAGKKRSENLKIRKYLSGVRILISIIGIVSLILWFFL
tara:strand:- start:279 stop:464 length:186 start_codon:yes stop_codon:yes gene_type:complete